MPELLLAAASFTVALTLGHLTWSDRSTFPRPGGYLLTLLAGAFGTAQLIAADVLWQPPEALAHIVQMTAAVTALLAAGFFWLRRSSFLQPEGRVADSGFAPDAAIALEEGREGYTLWRENLTDFASFELDTEGRVVAWHANAARLTGYCGDEMAGRRASAVESVDQADRQRWQQAFSKARPSGRVLWEGWRLRKDGDRFWARDVITQLAGPAGTVRGYYVIVRDLSEHRRLREQLLLSQRSETIGQLAGGVAHDFNNHLTVISGYSDLLQGRLEAGSTEAKQVAEIKRAGRRATALTRQLLAFTRRAVIETQQVDLNVIVEDLMKMMGRLLGEDIEVETALDVRIPALETDPGQLEQILLSLAIRARSEMPLGGKLLITTAAVELREGDDRLSQAGIQPGRYALLAADSNARSRDTKQSGHESGQGGVPSDRPVPANELPSGWAAALHAVEEMHGGVNCSALNGCARAEIYLPALVSPDPPKPLTTPATGEKHSGTILVVEDEEAVMSLIQSVLQEQGYQVLAVRDPLEARELAARHGSAIRLLLTDIVMPALSGPDLAHELVRKHHDLKVLFISGYASQIILDHGFKPAEAVLLRKPFEPDKLAGMVRRLLAEAA